MNKLIASVASAAGLALALGGGILGSTAASAAPDPGVYLSSTPTLTIGLPNKPATGKPVVLKTCVGGLTCAATANLKPGEFFNFLPVDPKPGVELAAAGNVWCVTNRATIVWEKCQGFASQRWSGSGGVLFGVLTNEKTGKHLAPTTVAPYGALQAANSLSHWGNSS